MTTELRTLTISNEGLCLSAPRQGLWSALNRVLLRAGWDMVRGHSCAAGMDRWE